MAIWRMANCCFVSGVWLCITMIVIVNIWVSKQTLVKGVTTRHALRHNLNIQKICDIFCPHTAHCLNRQQQTARSSNKFVSFHSVRFEGCGECWELRLQLRVQEINANVLFVMDEDTFIYCLLAI